jgi:two-component system, response regulator PdtaR
MQLGKKSVLVVDDEAIVRLVAAANFEEMGFQVLEAGSGHEALELLNQNPEVALLFTDCRMPGMSGPELAYAAVARYPHLKVVLVSSYVDNIVDGSWPLLSKPYHDDELKRIVEHELEGC